MTKMLFYVVLRLYILNSFEQQFCMYSVPDICKYSVFYQLLILLFECVLYLQFFFACCLSDEQNADSFHSNCQL